jgi:hypothetical protein
MRGFLFLTAFTLISHAAFAAETVINLEIKNHVFVTPTVEAAADTPIILRVTNSDATAEEFESHDLKLEKVIPGGKSAEFRVRPLKAGEYKFFGEFNEATAQGKLIVK